MKQKLLTVLAGAFLLAACNNEKKSDAGNDKKDTASISSTDAGDATATPADTTGASQRWMEYMTPGEMHKWLAKHTGTWEAEVSSWMDPSAPPSKEKATDVVKMSMNGLYQEGDFTSSMMGMPMMGHSTMGYNNLKKKFVSTWIDNMGSGIIMMEGDYDEASKTLNMKGKQSDPGLNKESDIRQELKFHDDDSYTMTMFGTGPDGKEMKVMEGTFKRKK
jgi:predicted small secreted protein